MLEMLAEKIICFFQDFVVELEFECLKICLKLLVNEL